MDEFFYITEEQTSNPAIISYLNYYNIPYTVLSRRDSPDFYDRLTSNSLEETFADVFNFRLNMVTGGKRDSETFPVPTASYKELPPL